PRARLVPVPRGRERRAVRRRAAALLHGRVGRDRAREPALLGLPSVPPCLVTTCYLTASCACRGCGQRPCPSSAGTGSSSRPKTSASAAAACGRTSSTVTGRSSSRAIVVNIASSSPHAVIHSVNGAGSRSTLSAYPCVVIQREMCTPIDAILRGGRV